MLSSTEKLSLFASTAKGLEELLKSELESLGGEQCSLTQGGVYFSGDQLLMYRTLLWSRLASRILLQLGEYSASDEESLYQAAYSIEWSELFSVSNTFVVHFVGSNRQINNTHFGALKIKDAIVDKFVHQQQQRPQVAKEQADIRIHAFLQRNKLILALDMSGESLHQRGYRRIAGLAPLKENLATAIILRSGWQKEKPMLDPMCGSGTLLIEAAMMAAKIAPGILRKYWGFQAWKQHNEALWQSAVKEAKTESAAIDMATLPHFYGYDLDERMIPSAQQNAKQAGVGSMITFAVQDIAQLTNPYPDEIKGVILTNPPYGERLANEPALIALYHTFGRQVKQHFPGWRLSILSTSNELLHCLPLRAERQFMLKNGALDCIQKNYLIASNANNKTAEKIKANITPGEPQNEVAIDYANRLRKNLKKLQKWVNREGINCYRIYDADLPEYNVAVDYYAGRVVIQEYAPPKIIEEQKARQRLFDVIAATMNVLALPASDVILKVRQRQKGKQQYEKLSEKGQFFLVQEYQARLWVNLTDYIDTGLFLDHRLVRKMIGEMSQGKDFLNLFAYTGSASVHAALGGAKTTTTVDMSATYLHWAERNLAENGFTGRSHRLIQADCLTWLQQTKDRFDLIFIDPPTFSNSKRMTDAFDIQQDYLSLLSAAKNLLRNNGQILFSNNKRRFKLDNGALMNMGLSAEEITNKTIPLDFSGNKHIHHCWLIRHLGEK